MASFLKHLATRLLAAGFKFYQNRTLTEIKHALYRQYEELIRSSVGASRGIFAALVAAALVAGGLVLLPLSGVALVFAVCDDLQVAAVIAFAGLLVVGAAYVLVPVIGVILMTRESTLRKLLGDAKAQRMLLDK